MSGSENTGDWEWLRGEDYEPITTDELAELDLKGMPEGLHVTVLDNDFPETTVWRTGRSLICEIHEHIYTKFWEHKFSAQAFAHSMVRAVRRLAAEGQQLGQPIIDDSDVHIFVKWQLRLPSETPPDALAATVKSTCELVWHRADRMLEDSDSVLVLGKDTGSALDLLQRIAGKLEDLGYYTYIIKEQPDVPGKSVIQKVMQYAVSSKFVVVENTEASGHLYEFPHIAKVAECVTLVLQETGKGATWMFEDGYAKHCHWHKVQYEPSDLEAAVERAATWAEAFIADFIKTQAATLPWLVP